LDPGTVELARELENNGKDILCKQHDEASGAGSGFAGAGPVWRSFFSTMKDQRIIVQMLKIALAWYLEIL
jgi:hypothetical protein